MKILTYFLLASLFMTLIIIPSAQSFGAGISQQKAVQRPQTVNTARQNAANRELQKYQTQIANSPASIQIGAARVLRTGAGITIKNAAQTQSTIYFQDNMENGVGGWSTDPASGALWHLTASNYSSPTHSWWIGDEISGTYNTGGQVNQSLVSPTIDLTAAPIHILLVFTEYYVTEKGKDRCMVDVTTDGGSSWAPLREGVSGNSSGWVLTSLDLSAYAGQTVKVRFHFDTGDELNNDFPGWYIDDVRVLDYPGKASGTVFMDLNKDGIKNGDDYGLQGWIVSAANIDVAETTVTDAAGNYNLILPYGTFTITENVPSGWVVTKPGSGQYRITILPGQELFTGEDFGDWHSALTISGYAFADDNRNGAQDNGEPLVPGQIISIQGGTNNWVDIDILTDVTGHFSYSVTDAGVYTVSTFYDGIAAFQSQPANGQPYTIQITNLSETIPPLVFGSVYPSRVPWTIGGYVVADDNNDGVQDSGEGLLPGQMIEISGGTNFPVDDIVVTDYSGHFIDNITDTGYYHVTEPIYDGGNFTVWPAGGYTVHIGLSQDTIRNLLFGAFYPDSGLSSVSGKVFSDLNRNGVQDWGEPGVSGVKVQFLSSYTVGRYVKKYTRYMYTDGTGQYTFYNVPLSPCTVSVHLPSGWVQIHPAGHYTYTIGLKTIITNADFALLPKKQSVSISGTIFNDVNGNGARDGEDNGIGEWTIWLKGPGGVNQMISDGNGNFLFNGLNGGNYRVWVASRTGWTETMPGDQYYSFSASVGDSIIHNDFGMHRDSTFGMAFRSFVAESLALVRDRYGNIHWTPIQRIYPSQVTFTAGFRNNHTDGKGANYLRMEFKLPVPDTLTLNPWGVQVYPSRNIVDIIYPTEISPGDTVFITGVANELDPSKPIAQKITHIWGNFFPNYYAGKVCSFTSQYTNIVPPNVADLFKAMGSTYVQVGNVAARSVLVKKPSDLKSSLIYRSSIYHQGPPTCFGFLGYEKVMTRQQSHFYPENPPTNNKLFSEAVALEANILASDLHLTPPGFGDLLYDDGSNNPLNGHSIRFIANVVNEYMSSNDAIPSSGSSADHVHCNMPAGFEWLDSLKLWQTIRNIDSAFSGPIRVVQWDSDYLNHLLLAPVRAVTDVAYMHINPSFEQTGKLPSSFTDPVRVPDRFQLMQNFPNPFNPTTTIEFDLPVDANVTLKIYNILGEEVGELLNYQAYRAGSQRLDFDASGLASGVYFYRIVAERLDNDGVAGGQRFTQVKKMMVIK